jgi:DNA-directed RNA polymerase sigma subunit (sigma70/sigma32)
MDRCQRYQSIVQFRKTMTLEEIGQRLGISGERVRQILKRRPD